MCVATKRFVWKLLKLRKADLIKPNKLVSTTRVGEIIILSTFTNNYSLNGSNNKTPRFK